MSDVCQVCKKPIKGKPIEYDSKKFGSQDCLDKFKKSEDEGICEFC